MPDELTARNVCAAAVDGVGVDEGHHVVEVAVSRAVCHNARHIEQERGGVIGEGDAADADPA